MPLLDTRQAIGTVLNFIKQLIKPAAKNNHVQMYAANSGGNDADTVAFLRFDEASGSATFADSSVQGNVVTRTGTAATSNLYQKFGGNSLSLDGASSVLIADNAEFAFAADFAIDCWIKPSVTNGTTHIVTQGNDTDNVWELQVRNNGIRFRFRIGGANVLQLQGGNVNPGNEYFISVSRKAGLCTLKINGETIDTDTDATAVPDYAAPIKVGERVTSGQNFTGFIDELRISKTARFDGQNTVPQTPFDATILFLKDDRGNEYPLPGGFVSTSGGGFWGKINDALFYDLGSVMVGTNTEPASALFALESTEKGLLIPRMTEAQKNAVATPATGLLVFETDTDPGFWFWNGSAWEKIGAASFKETYTFDFTADISDTVQGSVFPAGYDIAAVEFVSADASGSPFVSVEYEVNESGTWIDITGDQASLLALVINSTTVIAFRVELAASESQGYIRLS